MIATRRFCQCNAIGCELLNTSVRSGSGLAVGAGGGAVMTVLLVLAFFVALITHGLPGDPSAARPRGQALAAAPIPALEPAWVAGYQMPESPLLPPRPHLGPPARRRHGPRRRRRLRPPADRPRGQPCSAPSRGDWLHQGGRAFAHEGRRQGGRARLARRGRGGRRSTATWPRSPALAADDPYGRGWVLKVKAPQLAANLRNLLSGRLARKWMEDSREALELRLMALSGSVLQDGGEPAADLGHHLPKADWERLAHEFLLT